MKTSRGGGPCVPPPPPPHLTLQHLALGEGGNALIANKGVHGIRRGRKRESNRRALPPLFWSRVKNEVFLNTEKIEWTHVKRKRKKKKKERKVYKMILSLSCLVTKGN